ncbi:MAG TPA: TIGR03435 family protein [Bryobacteraceae bacterium]|nr:TIGR03435 family protein [Bryobacteraceae bacterium]
MRILVCVVFAAALHGQAAFEIADVHVSPHSDNPSLRVFHREGRYELLSATMVDLISTAYGVSANTVAGGPNWLESDRFDVIAKAPDDASSESLHAMLQTLLKDRFGLALHNDTKPIPALVLTAGKQLRLKQSPAGPGGGCEEQPAEHTPAINAAWKCRGITMKEFAELLRSSRNAAPLRGYLANKEIADQTGLKGPWDFDFRWTGVGLLPRAGVDGVTLFDALDKQLGLKLEMGMAPLPVLEVDKVNEKPGANPPGVTEKLPELRLQFDVADIRPSAQAAPTAPRFTPGGRMEVKGVALIALIQHAWGLDSYDNDLVTGGPKWLTTQRFDIVAKATPPDGPASSLKDDDSLRAMLRNLLTDRFRLTLHTEQQPVTVLALHAEKPKLKPADPSERSKCTEGAAPSTPGGAAQRLIVCTNTTPAQFAERLRGLSPGNANRPVVDETGIDVAFDLSLLYSGPRIIQAAITRGDGAPAGEAPTGAVSLFDALEKQTGIRVTTEKRTIPVLAIDHVEQQPTDN